MQEKIKLSAWAKENNMEYKTAWKLADSGELPAKIERNKKGSIFVMKESRASKFEAAVPLFADFGEKKEAKASRRNRSSTITPTDQYKHIEEGLDVFNTSNRSGNGNDCVNVSEAIRLTRKCYYNFSDLMNIINTLVEFSTAPIYYRGGNAKTRKFFTALFNKVGIMNLQPKFYMEYYRSCNVFPVRFETVIKDDDLANLNRVYGANAGKKIKLPTKYVIIDPSSVIVGGNISFSNPLFYQRLNAYEVQRLLKPVTDEDRDFLASLPPDTRQKLKSGNQSIDIPLNPDNAYFIFYKKQDYEPMAVPMAWPVLRDINAKQELKNMDMATARTTMRAVLHVAMGFENKTGEIFIDAKAMDATRALFESESIGKVLVTDFTTKVSWVIPDISKLLSPEKYKQLNDDIRAGLNNILVGTDEKFANQSIKVKLFIQRLVQSREVFLNEFLIPEIKRISKEMGFRSSPTPYFQDLDFKDGDLWNRVVTQLVQMGVLTSWEATEAIETGILPDKEQSIENQREFKELKDEGLYQTPQGNVSGQLELLGEQGKQAIKTQEKQLEHDDKQKSKDRKFNAENPAPAPVQMVAPKALKQQPGKPKGAKSDGPIKKKVKPISASLIKNNLVLATELNKELTEQLCKKYKSQKLNNEQELFAGTLLENVMMNEEPGQWKDVVAEYIKNPDKQNPERFNEVIEIGKTHAVNDYLASIIYASQGEEIEVEEN